MILDFDDDWWKALRFLTQNARLFPTGKVGSYKHESYKQSNQRQQRPQDDVIDVEARVVEDSPRLPPPDLNR